MIKKVCCIVALGGFCMPAQAMWHAVWTLGGWLTPQKRSLAEYLQEEDFFKKHKYDEEIFVQCYEKADKQIDGEDSLGKTALCLALENRDDWSVWALLSMGADIHKVNIAEARKKAVDLVYQYLCVINACWHIVPKNMAYIQLIRKLKDFELLESIAACYKDYLLKNYDDYVKMRLFPLQCTSKRDLLKKIGALNEEFDRDINKWIRDHGSHYPMSFRAYPKIK